MTCAVVGNKNGYVGIGTGKSKETVPARDKSKRNARLNLMKIRRGSGSWESNSTDPTSIPFAVTGKCGSVKITLIPAPRGQGLCIERECAKILELAGIKDIWSRTQGQTKTKLNMVFALVDALEKLSEVKLKSGDIAKHGIVDGKLTREDSEDLELLKVVEAEVKKQAQASQLVDGAQQVAESVADVEAENKADAKAESAVETESKPGLLVEEVAV